MSILALSPHLDDAAFSAAARLTESRIGGEQCTVLTVFAGDADRVPPLAQQLHRAWQLDEDAVAVRRREDLEACRQLDVTPVHWDFRDAIYREDLPEDPRTATLWLFRMYANPALIRRCAERLQQFLDDQPHDTVLLPLGIGGHVDHRVVRAAAEQVTPAAQRLYYEDYPYRRSHRKRWRALWPPGQFRSNHLSVTEQLLAAKCRAVRCYRSQLNQIAPPRELDAKLERDFARFERFWRIRQRGGSSSA